MIVEVLHRHGILTRFQKIRGYKQGEENTTIHKVVKLFVEAIQLSKLTYYYIYNAVQAVLGQVEMDETETGKLKAQN